jgi:hypothetical protein
MKVVASDFASLADLAAFRRAKARGLTDKQAFAIGDNGVGCWGDLTAQNHTPMCALPPDDMIEKFGTVAKAAHRRVRVAFRDRAVVCILADRMPWKKNIKNGRGIDLNPAAIDALGLRSPVEAEVEWAWV